MNTHAGDLRPIAAMKCIIFNSKYVAKLDFYVKLSRVLQPIRNFVIPVPHAYHSRFTSGYNVAIAPNFADSPSLMLAYWCQKAWECFFYQQCFVKVVFVLCRECGNYVIFIQIQLEDTLLFHFAVKLLKERHIYISLTVQMSERKPANTPNNNWYSRSSQRLSWSKQIYLFCLQAKLSLLCAIVCRM